MFSVLLRIARAVVQSVLSQLHQQFNILEESVKSPMQQIVGSLVDPSWKGDGADKFKEEVSRLFIPGVGQIGSQIQGVRSNLQRAVDVMDRADQQAQSLAHSASELFGKIF